MYPTPPDTTINGHLERLSRQIEKQNSFWHMFIAGVIYGVGFFVGSAIIATIAFGLFGPWFGQFAWIRSAFETGVSLLR